MKSSEILTRAAELVDSGEEIVACDAIWTAVGRPMRPPFRDDKVLAFFEKLFRPKFTHLCWFGEPEDEANQQHRVMALLLCAAIAESEGD